MAKIKITEPYDGTVRIKFPTGLRVDIREAVESDGRPALYINAAGHDEDGSRETIYVRPESANSMTVFFDKFRPGKK